MKWWLSLTALNVYASIVVPIDSQYGLAEKKVIATFAVRPLSRCILKSVNFYSPSFTFGLSIYYIKGFKWV
ncbi:hypothetical protein [Paenisporosarcina antarctica]|uniref:hypothetical protein n=1 Tax=Paenisporosarcina antarctica TaxID=417367 RepID=UPI001416F1C4|nr:hypothetical protein [Paenisporosarcina antarctica]